METFESHVKLDLFKTRWANLPKTTANATPLGSGRQTFLRFIDHRARATDIIPILFVRLAQEAAYQDAWVGVVLYSIGQ